jgi:hypothetical protein
MFYIIKRDNTHTLYIPGTARNGREADLRCPRGPQPRQASAGARRRRKHCCCRRRRSAAELKVGGGGEEWIDTVRLDAVARGLAHSAGAAKRRKWASAQVNPISVHFFFQCVLGVRGTGRYFEYCVCGARYWSKHTHTHTHSPTHTWLRPVAHTTHNAD